jgi:hypothetical protein
MTRWRSIAHHEAIADVPGTKTILMRRNRLADVAPNVLRFFWRDDKLFAR